MQAEILQETLPFLSGFFLNPLGLLALAGLIPLLIFYLVRPEPEEKVMPSMMFFRKQESDSKLRNALRTLLRNFILLLHIFIVVGFAFAMADPFIEMFENNDEAVVVVDRSASMEGKRAQTLDFLDGNLGKENTVILVDDEAEIKAEEATPQEVMDIVRSMTYHETETDIATGIQTTVNFPGKLILASDLDQSVDSRNIQEKLDSINKPVTSMNPEITNRWAVTGIDIEDNTTDISVQSFQAENTTVKLEINQRNREFKLTPGLNTLEVDHATGRNTVKLPEDALKVDNTAYFFVPDSGRIGVEMHGERNRYFETAVELIKQTEETVSTSGNPPEIYALRDNPANLEKEKVRNAVNSGAAAIVFPGSNAMKDVFEYDTETETLTGDVQITSPQNIDVGETEYIKRSIESGESLSEPAGAVKIHSYGEGKILSFNIKSQGFRENILYPIFWKHAMLRISDKPTVDELNLQTGSILNNQDTGNLEDQSIKITEKGFHTSGDTTYAANLVSRDESAVETLEYSSSGSGEQVKIDRSLQNLSILILLLLMSIEVSYLYYRGDI